MNPKQVANRFAHRPELKDLGWWFYSQRNRINARLRKVVIRVEKRRREVTKNQLA